MAKEYPRTLRVGEQLRRELAVLVHDQVKDPRVAGITVLEVEVSKDLRHARVYYAIPPGREAAADEYHQGLVRAAGFLRRELGKRLSLRVVPDLRFIHDTTELRADRIESLIARGLRQGE